MKTVIEIKKEVKGLVIRYWSTGLYALCDGKAPEGCKVEEGEIYTGTVVQWFKTWEEADEMRKLIAALYK